MCSAVRFADIPDLSRSGFARTIMIPKSLECLSNGGQITKNIVYVGFVIINIEVLEIIIDGLLGTHRVFSFLGVFYDFLIASFEILALLVLVGVIVFWIRRNIQKIKRIPFQTFWYNLMGEEDIRIEIRIYLKLLG